MMDDAQPIASSIAGNSGMVPEVTRQKISAPTKRRKRVNEDGTTDTKKSVRTAISTRTQRKKAKAPSMGNNDEPTTASPICPTNNVSCTDDFFEDLEDDPALVTEEEEMPPVRGSKRTLRKKTVSTVRKRKKRVAASQMVVVEYRDPSLVLLIDRREIGGCRKIAGDLEAHIRKYSPHMAYDVRTLALGDFVWICQVTEYYREEEIGDDSMEEPPLQSRKREFVLPWIIERKTLQDLLGSVHGSRYRDQKSRLLKFLKDPSIAPVGLKENSCPLDSVTQSIEPLGILLIEASHDVSLNQPIFHQQYYDLPNDKNARNTVVGAQINSQARDNLHLLQTANLDHTASMLVKLHTALEHKFNQLIPHYLDVVTDGAGKSRRLSFLSYGMRYKPGATETVQSLMEQQLRLVPGVTPIVAQVLSQEYRTPSKLIEAINGFTMMSQQERRVLSGVGQRALESLYSHLTGKALTWYSAPFNCGAVATAATIGETDRKGRPSIRIPLDDDENMVVNNISAPLGEKQSIQSEAEAIRLIERIREREAAENTGGGGYIKEPQSTSVWRVSPARSNLPNIAVRSLCEGDNNKEPNAPPRRSVISPLPPTDEETTAKGRSRVSVIEF